MGKKVIFILRIIEKVGTMRKRKATETAKASRTRKVELEDEIICPPKALEYSELHNEALNEDIFIRQRIYTSSAI